MMNRFKIDAVWKVSLTAWALFGRFSDWCLILSVYDIVFRYIFEFFFFLPIVALVNLLQWNYRLLHECAHESQDGKHLLTVTGTNCMLIYGFGSEPAESCESPIFKVRKPSFITFCLHLSAIENKKCGYAVAIALTWIFDCRARCNILISVTEPEPQEAETFGRIRSWNVNWGFGCGAVRLKQYIFLYIIIHLEQDQASDLNR